MRIDIADIAGKNGAYILVSEEFLTEALESGIAGIELDGKVHADLKIEYIEGIIIVEGRITGRYSAECGRCLKAIKKDFEIDIAENFVHISANHEDTDDYLYEGNHIDLTIPMIDNILLSFPNSMLCDENCKGLCEMCGADLNVKQCSCEKHDINVKMEKLKDYFNQ